MSTSEHPSKYSTDEVWDEIYSKELLDFSSEQNINGNFEWYEEYQERILDWIDSNWESWSDIDRSQARVLDLGTGNGLFLARLYAIGFTSTLTGIDYSSHAISCARSIASKIQEGNICVLENLGLTNNNPPHESYNPNFVVDDIMVNPSSHQCNESRSFDLILDKGTLDVFNLRHQASRMIEQVEAKYAMTRCAKPIVWVIASCTMTQCELRDLVEKHSDFELNALLQEVPHITFSGHTGRVLSVGAFSLRGIHGNSNSRQSE